MVNVLAICRYPRSPAESLPCAQATPSLCDEGQPVAEFHRWHEDEWGNGDCALCGTVFISATFGMQTNAPQKRVVMFRPDHEWVLGHGTQASTNGCFVKDPLRFRASECSTFKFEGVMSDSYPGEKRWLDRKTWWMRRCVEEPYRYPKQGESFWCADIKTPLIDLSEAMFEGVPLLSVALALGEDATAKIVEALAWDDAGRVQVFRDHLRKKAGWDGESEIGWDHFEALWLSRQKEREATKARDVVVVLPPEDVMQQAFEAARSAMDAVLTAVREAPLGFPGTVGREVVEDCLRAVRAPPPRIHGFWTARMEAGGFEVPALDESSMVFNGWHVFSMVLTEWLADRKAEGAW